MKNADPKVVGTVVAVIIVLCIIMVMRSLGVGQDSKAPPIATGMPSSLAPGGGQPNISMPGGMPPGSASGGTMAPGMGGGTTLPTPGGGTTLPTPGAAGGGNTIPMPNMPK